MGFIGKRMIGPPRCHPMIFTPTIRVLLGAKENGVPHGAWGVVPAHNDFSPTLRCRVLGPSNGRQLTPHGRVRFESQRYQREIVKQGRFPCHQDLLNHGFLGSPFLSFPTDTRWGVQCIPVTGRCTWRCGVHPHRAKELDHPPNVWLTHGRHVSRGSSPTAYLL